MVNASILRKTAVALTSADSAWGIEHKTGMFLQKKAEHVDGKPFGFTFCNVTLGLVNRFKVKVRLNHRLGISRGTITVTTTLISILPDHDIKTGDRVWIPRSNSSYTKAESNVGTVKSMNNDFAHLKMDGADPSKTLSVTKNMVRKVIQNSNSPFKTEETKRYQFTLHNLAGEVMFPDLDKEEYTFQELESYLRAEADGRWDFKLMHGDQYIGNAEDLKGEATGNERTLLFIIETNLKYFHVGDKVMIETDDFDPPCKSWCPADITGTYIDHESATHELYYHVIVYPDEEHYDNSLPQGERLSSRMCLLSGTPAKAAGP